MHPANEPRHTVLALDRRGESVRRAQLFAWAVFLAASAVMAVMAGRIATTHAQAPASGGAHATHARFVVDVPGLPGANLAAIPSPLVLVHGASTKTSLQLALLDPAPGAPEGHASSTNALQLAIGAARAPDRVGIGGTWNLGGHRALVLDLTPSPRHCAPLVQVSF